MPIGDGRQRVVIPKLLAAVSTACAVFKERVRECRVRSRADVIKHLVKMTDIRFLQELDPLTTGTVPSRLLPQQLLALIDCVEGILRARTEAIGGLNLAPHVRVACVHARNACAA